MRAGLVYLDFAEHYPEHYRLMFMSELPPTPPGEGEREDPAQNAYVFVRALTSELMQHDLLRADLTDVDLVAQSVWGTVHGAAALDLMVHRSQDWLDFRPRRERFAAALELVARGVARDPEAAVATVRRVLRDSRRPQDLAAAAPDSRAGRKPASDGPVPLRSVKGR